MTIAHTGIKTPAARHAEVVAWYEVALAPLGYTRAMAFLDGQVVGLADASGTIDWWITSAGAAPPGVPVAGDGKGEGILPVHTAFGAAGEFISLPCLFLALRPRGASFHLVCSCPLHRGMFLIWERGRRKGRAMARGLEWV